MYIVSGLQKASGVTTFVENVAAELRALGQTVDIVTRATEKGGVRKDEAVRASDIVHIHGLWTPWLHGWAKAARKAGVKVVWSPHGMLTPWAMHYKWLKKRVAWFLYQKRDLQLADVLHVTVPSEEDDVRRVGLTPPVVVVPLGVRMADFASHDTRGGVSSALCQSGPSQEGACQSHPGLGGACA